MRAASLITILVLMFSSGGFSQKTKLDSLLNDKLIHDTIMIKEVLDYGSAIQDESLDSALYLYNLAIDLIDKKIDDFDKQQKIERTLKSLKSLSLRYIGVVYHLKGSFDKAIEYNLKSINISEEIEDKIGISLSLGNIGNIHVVHGNYDQGIEYFMKSLAVFEELGDRRSMSACYNNIGVIHQFLGNLDLAIEFYHKSLKTFMELGDKSRISDCYGNIGLVKLSQGKYDEAIDYYKKSKEIFEEEGDKNGMASVYSSIASLHITLADSVSKTDSERQFNYEEALKYGNKSIALSREIKATPLENLAAKLLMDAHKKLGNYKKSLEFAEVFILTNQNMFSEEKTKVLTEMHEKYEADKKQQEIEKQQLIIKNREIDYQRQRTRLNLLISASALLGLLVFVVLIAYRQKNKSSIIISQKNALLEQYNEEIKATSEALSTQNETLKNQNDEIENQRNSLANLAWELQEQGEEIEMQKNVLAKKNKEITDSIVYAQRIQSAVLPSNSFLKQLFADYFVLYKPKSIVSGDFYWATRIRELLIFCVTDCTGHGVPGAFMSMMGVSFLNEIVRKEETTNTAKVLNALREHVVSSMVEHDEGTVQFDGMDMGLCVLNIKTLELQFSGANIPCWIATSTPDERVLGSRAEIFKGLVELKPDRMPIGRYERMVSFSFIDYQLKKDDYIYISTDGFSDQFGGDSGKKFQKIRLMELISENKNLPLSEQKTLLDSTFEQWKGARSQVDDVTILGIKV
jgi:serine phosphatase RsbU (regulator of sigma subunit)